MKRVMVTYAGGAAGIGFTRSLQSAPELFYTIGLDSNAFMLQRAETDERHLVPRADDPEFIPVLVALVRETRPDVLCVQLSREIRAVSPARDALGTRTFLPSHRTIEVCENKMASQAVWERAGLPVPRSMLVKSEEDLAAAFRELGPRLWLRAITGTGGKGAFPTSDFDQARMWVQLQQGWGRFMAAECLEKDSVTWQSIWRSGELLVAQSRKRLYWEFAGIAPSGVTGITGAGMTVTDPVLSDTARAAVLAIDPRPHGIFSVDLTYDSRGTPRLTEINCGRFFTTHHFFTAAGLNMPYIYLKAALDEKLPPIPRKLDPLSPGLVWVRGMDVEPVLTNLAYVESFEKALEERRTKVRGALQPTGQRSPT